MGIFDSIKKGAEEAVDLAKQVVDKATGDVRDIPETTNAELGLGVESPEAGAEDPAAPARGRRAGAPEPAEAAEEARAAEAARAAANETARGRSQEPKIDPEAFDEDPFEIPADDEAADAAAASAPESHERADAAAREQEALRAEADQADRERREAEARAEEIRDGVAEGAIMPGEQDAESPAERRSDGTAEDNASEVGTSRTGDVAEASDQAANVDEAAAMRRGRHAGPPEAPAAGSSGGATAAIDG